MVSAQTVTIQAIPNPRPGGWSVDLTGQVAVAGLDSINRLAGDAARQLDGELAVVVVESIGGADPRTFATELFNTWGIGTAERDNGILIFVALGDRAAELILGDGIDDAPQVTMANQIMQQLMVPRLRQGDVTNAVLLGAQASVERILRPLRPEVAFQPIGNVPLESEGAAPPRPLQALPSENSTSGGPGPLAILGLLAGGTGALFGAGRYRRYRSRNCACGAPRQRLGEAADDAYLDSSEQAEESVGSVDYDVWLCPQCGDADKLRYSTVFTRYSTCPRCQARTRNKISRTVREATYASGGLVELTERCAHCNHRKTYFRTTAQLTHTSSGSSSSGGSSSGFSGGSSSGGGASGRW